MKKIILLFLLFVSTQCDAQIYLGGQAGLSVLVGDRRTGTPDEKYNLGGFGFTGGGFAGYQFDFCYFDLCVEAFIFGNSTHNTMHHTISGTTSRLSAHYKYNWGLRALPGFYITNCVETHLIAGITVGNFSLKDSGIVDVFHKNFNSVGYQIGGGITVDMGYSISLRFDGVFDGYHFHRYPNVEVMDGSAHKIKFYTFEGTVAALYKF